MRALCGEHRSTPLPCLPPGKQPRAAGPVLSLLHTGRHIHASLMWACKTGPIRVSVACATSRRAALAGPVFNDSSGGPIGLGPLITCAFSSPTHTPLVGSLLCTARARSGSQPLQGCSPATSTCCSEPRSVSLLSSPASPQWCQAGHLLPPAAAPLISAPLVDRERERAIRRSRCSPFTPLNPLLITPHGFLRWRVCNMPVAAPPPPPPPSTCHLMLGLLTGDSSSQTEPGTRTKPASTAAVWALNRGESDISPQSRLSMSSPETASAGPEP